MMRTIWRVYLHDRHKEECFWAWMIDILLFNEDDTLKETIMHFVRRWMAYYKIDILNFELQLDKIYAQQPYLSRQLSPYFPFGR